MLLYDEKEFGLNLVEIRKVAGRTWQQVAKVLETKIGVHPKHYISIEMGKAGKEIDDKIIDELMDILPGFSPSSMRGVFPPTKEVKDIEDLH